MLLLAMPMQAREKLSFYRDVQPLIYKHCTGCHRPGQSAPFSLVSYTDVVRHAATIKEVIATGYMPPWKADTGYRTFVDQRILSAAEIKTLTAWIDGGMAMGDKTPDIDIAQAYGPSNLGKPDLIVAAPEVFTVPGTNQDSIAYFVMHYSIPADTNVLAFEFLPGDPKAVHHSNTWVFPEESEYERFYPKHESEIIPSPVAMEYIGPGIYDMFIRLLPVGVATPGDHIFTYPDFFPKVPPLYYDGWVPGTSPRRWPQGFGFRLPAKGIIIMQVHYGPTPIERHDRSSVNIFFTDRPITRMIESFNIGTGGGIADPVPALVLPPDSVKSFEITTTVEREQSYIALNPHMHYLGKEMKAFAITPAHDTIPLVWIKHWDFRWQEFYKPLSLIRIPAGSVIKVLATFDNTAANPENRFSPPRQVMGGANSTEEMMSLIVMSVDFKEGDESIKLSTDLPAQVPVPPQQH